MKKIFLLILASAAGLYGQTAINDTLYLQGSPWTGTISVCWPPFTSAAGTAVAKGCRDSYVTAGTVAISLYPTEGAAPSFVYTASYRQTTGAGRGTKWDETWGVPASPSITTLAAVRLTSSRQVFPSEIDGGGAGNGWSIVWSASQGRAVWALVAGGPGGGGAWGLIGGTLTDQTDLANALAGKASLSHAHLISDITSLQSALDGKSNTGHSHAIADSTGLQTALNAKEATANKGIAGGYAPLDGTGKVPAVNLPSSSGMTAIIQDTAPQLGGDVDMNGWSIQTVTATEMAFVHGLSSGLQAQLNGKAATGHTHAGVYEPVDATILRQSSLAGTGAATTPARSDHTHAAYAPLASPTFTGTVNGITKGMVGLNNVDNTTDAGKPVSTAQATAIALKQNAPTISASAPTNTCTTQGALYLYTGVTPKQLWLCPAVGDNWLLLLASDMLGTGALTIAEGAAPANPAAGSQTIYIGTDHLPYLLNSAGVSTAIGGSGGSVTVNGQTCTIGSTCTISATNISTGTLPAAQLPNPGVSSLGGVRSIDCTGIGHIDKITTSGVTSCSADSGGGGSVTPATTDTFTNKTIDAEGTGNVITIPFIYTIGLAVCQGSFASIGLSLPTTNFPTPLCSTGTNTNKGYVQFTATSQNAQGHFTLPDDWTGAIDVKGKYVTESATSGNVDWGIQTVCVASGSSADPSWNTVQTITDPVLGSLLTNDFSLTSVTTTGCTAGSELFFKLTLGAGTTASGNQDLMALRFVVRRAM